MGARQTAAGYRYRNSAGGWLEKLALIAIDPYHYKEYLFFNKFFHFL